MVMVGGMGMWPAKEGKNTLPKFESEFFSEKIPGPHKEAGSSEPIIIFQGRAELNFGGVVGGHPLTFRLGIL